MKRQKKSIDVQEEDKEKRVKEIWGRKIRVRKEVKRKKREGKRKDERKKRK